MALILKNKKALSRYIFKQANRIEAALIYRLEFFIAELQNHAKSSAVAGYQDQTSNLKSSIGGVLLKDGKPVTYVGFTVQTTGDKGPATGLNFLDSLLSKFGKGYVIVIVAGMEYATYVENYHNLNVLKKTELKMQAELPKIIQELKLKFK